MNPIADLLARPWDELAREAWATRQQHHPAQIAFAVPGGKRYATEHYVNTPHAFASLSVTGQRCDLGCEHCRSRLLEGMLPARTPDEMLAAGERLLAQGCQGVLISGGADANGAVPLKPLLPAIAALVRQGLRVIVHTGLADEETAQGLRDAGVEQALFDVVGDQETIRQVLHLDRTPADYAATLDMFRRVGLPVAPHIVIGLHYGEWRGEPEALRMILEAQSALIVFVVLRPVPGTPMADIRTASPDTVGRLVATARILAPGTPLTLGCARPAGPQKADMEHRALLAGVNSIAYPDPTTVELARARGLATSFVESCCTLTVGI